MDPKLQLLAMIQAYTGVGIGLIIGLGAPGVLRAVLHNFTAGSARQGASTITMQVARNFFLTKEKTLTRKFNEALLAFKIERSLTKDQILEIYINQIYLGQRAYGFASAAQVYFGRNLRDLNLGEIAMLAGLPKAPSRYNPVVNLQRAKDRQLYVLRRMRDLDFIKPAQFEEAVAVLLRRHGYRDVKRIGGAGDLGADLIGREAAHEIDKSPIR